MADVNATQARNAFFGLVKEAAVGHRVVRIHHREGDVVLMSEAEYEGLQETLALLSIAGFRESIETSLKQIERGETFSLDEVFGPAR